ncbi:fibronectin type III domain-containing protein [Streptomyces sp. WAC05374]|uniref:fibronectin type III domain-containing protein n=1 Tax=Streptomyces sp. WAC05374 TaxID=2487420 RepID=UPI000F899518|nr:fibronectin type III domain-containing protein [Streptomyces sp. WAC05374]RST07536.1 fibronectin type III domain-containing protein [Streptomyces sp. WAC05374]
MQRPLTAAASTVAAAVLLTACGGADADEARDARRPSTPAGVTAQAGSATSVHVMWERSTDDRAVTGYEVLQAGRKVAAVPASRTMVDVERLTPSTAYRFTVRARDAADNSSPDSPPVDLTTARAAGSGPSTAPTGLTATARKGAVDLTWTPPDTGAPVKEHQLFLNGAFATTIVWGAQPPPGPVRHTFTVTDGPGTRYTVKVRAKLPDGTWGDFSAQRTVVIP